jgi:hypothetical protein
MDYENIKCPVCDKVFTKDDDIVVCPECGTPHHRECYELENRCAFEEKHKDGFVFGKSNESGYDAESADFNDSAENQENMDGFVECPRCKSKNPDNTFYCSKCGFPLKFKNDQNQQNNQQYGNPQYGNVGMNGFMDPMAGVNPEYKLDEDVTAGEAAKFVQKNTPYFMRVFYNIKEFGKSRFSFCGFIFGGGYLLYRKMYKLGTVISSIMFVLMMAQIYVQLSPAGTEFYKAINSATEGMTAYSDYYANIGTAFTSMSLTNQILIAIMSICSILEIILRIVVGVKANRWYLRHTTKQTKTIKSKENVSINYEMETKGGVNTALALSLLFVYFALEYLPSILSVYM